MPSIVPPGAPRMGKKLPSEKKKRMLKILVGLLMFTTVMAIVTGLYFYITYVR